MPIKIGFNSWRLDTLADHLKYTDDKVLMNLHLLIENELKEREVII